MLLYIVFHFAQIAKHGVRGSVVKHLVLRRVIHSLGTDGLKGNMKFIVLDLAVRDSETQTVCQSASSHGLSLSENMAAGVAIDQQDLLKTLFRSLRP